MLTMVILLAIISTALELSIASQVPLWRKWSYQSKLFNLLNSIFLSYIIGFMFGAQGLIVMTAGILSTFMTIPGYALLNWNYDTDKAKAQSGNRFQHTKTTIKPKMEKGKELAGDLLKVGYVTGKTVTAPIWVTRKAVRYYKSHKS
jgi:hypothetical protein